jgi:hypothetical protein
MDKLGVICFTLEGVWKGLEDTASEGFGRVWKIPLPKGLEGFGRYRFRMVRCFFRMVCNAYKFD